MTTDLFNQALLQSACRDMTDLSVFAYDCCDSTNARAKEWLLAGNRGVALFAAAEQTAGRGRRGRGFYSPAGSGVYFSLAYTPNEPLSSVVGVTCAAAVAVMRAIRSCTGRQAAIKWVNDLLLDEKKICGILAEAVTTGQTTGTVIGIGINLHPATFPSELADIAGSIGDRETPRTVLVAEAVRQLLPYLRDPEKRDWLADYRAHSCVIGRQITLTRGEETVAAVAVGIDEDGGLNVRTEQGVETLKTGEITLRLR